MRLKTVTIGNAFEVDPEFALRVTIDLHAGSVRGATAEDWLADVASLVLDDRVANPVRESFAFTAGGLSYAYWYAPLLTTVTHDMLRVADLATVEACRLHDVRHHAMTARIVALTASGFIAAADEPAWEALRRSRDALSHPTAGRIYGYADAYRTIATIRDLINRMAWNP